MQKKPTSRSAPAHRSLRLAVVLKRKRFGAGATRYLHDDGVIYNDTRACFLWSEDGTSTLFQPSHNLETTRSVYFPRQITPDGTKLVGNVAFLDARTTGAWVGERDVGLKYLQLPPESAGGSA